MSLVRRLNQPLEVGSREWFDILKYDLSSGRGDDDLAPLSGYKMTNKEFENYKKRLLDRPLPK